MRNALFAIAAASISVAASSAQAQTQDIWTYCKDPHPQVRLAACSVIIESGHETGKALADAYSSRGTAYSITGDQTHAIADFDQSIELDPTRTLVFGFRASAHFARRI
jgi:hypothetical protein